MNHFRKIHSQTLWKKTAKKIRDSQWQMYSFQIAVRILTAMQNNKEMSQAKLAIALGVSKHKIRRIIKGKENLSLENIHKLSQALECDLIGFPRLASDFLIGSKLKPSKQKTKK